MWYQVSPVRIRLSAPEIKNRPTGVFLFLCKDTDSNRRKSRSNRGSHTLSLSLRRATPTFSTLAYDCGNPVQYVCGRNARTSLSFPRPGPGHVPPLQWRGTKYVPSRGKVPLCGGVGEYRAPRDLSRGWLARGGLFHCTRLGVFIRPGGVCIRYTHRCIHNT